MAQVITTNQLYLALKSISEYNNKTFQPKIEIEPAPTEEVSKFLAVNADGDIIAVENNAGGNIPEVTTEDDGKILRVVNGKWQAVSIPLAEEVAF